MTQRDAVALIDHPFLRAPLPRGGPSLASASAVTFTPTRWADLGCGSGTFTLALAELLPPGSTIEAIDLRPGIKPQTTAGGVTIIPRVADFVADDLALTGLDGILMANSLHYVRDKPALLQKLRAYYRGNDPASGAPTSGASTPGGTPLGRTPLDAGAATAGALLLVEYDTDRSTPHWVPYPLSFAAAEKLVYTAGWTNLQKLGSRPSAFGRSELYAVLAR